MADPARGMAIALTAGVLLMILAILLSIGSEVNQNVKENLPISSRSVTNETITAPTDGTFVALSAFGDANSPALPEGYGGIIVTNGSFINSSYGGNVIPRGGGDNYTIDFQGGRINISAALGGGEYNVTFAPNVYTSAWAIAVNGSLALGEIGENQSTFATVIVAVIIIGMIITGFGAFIRFGGGGTGF